MSDLIMSDLKSCERLLSRNSSLIIHLMLLTIHHTPLTSLLRSQRLHRVRKRRLNGLKAHGDHCY